MDAPLRRESISHLCTAKYKASPKLSLKFFIEEGLLLEHVSRDGPTGLAANRRFVEILDIRRLTKMSVDRTNRSTGAVHWRKDSYG